VSENHFFTMAIEKPNKHFCRKNVTLDPVFLILIEISFDISPPPLVEDPERFDRSGALFLQVNSSFSCPCKKTEAKETARVPLNPARRRHGRSTRKLASLRQSARFLSGRIADARRGTKGNSKHRSQKLFSSPLRGGFLKPPAMREETHSSSKNSETFF
jgi:hypothetical protein